MFVSLHKVAVVKTDLEINKLLIHKELLEAPSLFLFVQMEQNDAFFALVNLSIVLVFILS